MSSFTTKNRVRNRDRDVAYRDANDFAIATFIKLRKDDTCWNRFLRFLRLKRQQIVRK